MKKVSIIMNNFTDSLGGEKRVFYGMIEALQEKQNIEVSAYSEHEESIDEINDYFNYQIHPSLDHYKVERPLLAKLLEKTGRFFLLRQSIENEFFAKLGSKLSQENNIVIFASDLLKTSESYDSKVVQYIHDNPLEEEIEKKNKLYKSLIRNFSDTYVEDSDIYLFNSNYTKKNTQFRGESEVIYPPVTSDIEWRDWGEKENQAVVVGRIAEDKKIEEAIEIIGQTDLDLVIAGFKHQEYYYQKIKSQAEEEDWIKLKTDLPWKELKKEISRSKIGLMCKREEDFGMPAVEYMKGGTIPVVYNGGGLPEVVGDEKFVYNGINEAIKKIRMVTGDSQKIICQRHQNFGAEKFKQKLVEVLNQDGSQ